MVSTWLSGVDKCGLLISQKFMTHGFQVGGEDYLEMIIKIVGCKQTIEIPVPFAILIWRLEEMISKEITSQFIPLHPKYTVGGGLLLQRYEPKHSHLRVTGFMIESQDASRISSWSGRVEMIEGISLEKLNLVVHNLETMIVCTQ